MDKSAHYIGRLATAREAYLIGSVSKREYTHKLEAIHSEMVKHVYQTDDVGVYALVYELEAKLYGINSSTY